ncbi:DNA-directed RNA polymerase III, subunit Rpc31 [Ephemerocybe angulata]|uniref:DNA-directed RNA polymerase III, subunit Rpc31 n=1 Tax=Ephemerocybe angulata TaxID=980116 RepID=A0A8H6IEW5_9AGAR|nr:DNA-directed RNA polymerase III, subunit Rpc31 [Tulosesus angulatus]
MSRGGGRFGGRGGGRGGFAGGATQPPMGLTFADLQNLSREATALYPARHLPVFTDATEDEGRAADLQLGLISRLKDSQYYIVEKTRSNGLPRYSDKYRPSLTSQPALKRKELHAPFFPSELLEDYFNPKRRKKTVSKSGKARVNIDELLAEDEEEKSDDERSDAGSQNEAEDYDVDEEDDNDYAGKLLRQR